MTAESRPGPSPSPGLDAQIAADFPGDELLAALLSPSPAARPRRRRAAPAHGSRARRSTVRDGSRLLRAPRTGTYQPILAYAATLAPGPDGTARIDPAAALAWILASGTWPHADRPAGEQRKVISTTLANLVGKGRISRDEAGYRTNPPGAAGTPAGPGS